MSRFARRVDDNHRAVVAALRAHGAWVVDLSSLGGGVLDLLVGHRGRWLLVEVKDGSKPPSKRQLTPLEADFLAGAQCRQLPAYVVESVDEAVNLLKGDVHD